MFDLSKDLFGNPLDAKIPKDNKKSKLTTDMRELLNRISNLEY